MRKYRKSREEGFSLVELMIVSAIMAILASVAVPAYINYVNRVRQSEATSQLLTARLEMEEWRTDYGRYASTIGCLPSFGNTCTLAATTSFTYTFAVESANTTYYRVGAIRTVYSWASSDRVTISANTANPVIQNEDALKFSVVKWLFD